MAALKLAVGACANLPKVTSWRIVGLVELIVEQEECYKVFMVWFGMFEPTNLIIDCRIDLLIVFASVLEDGFYWVFEGSRDQSRPILNIDR